MKRLLVIAVAVLFTLFIGAFKPNQDRYFFIGYYSNSSAGGIWLVEKSGHFPNYQYCKEEIKKYLKLEGGLAITSIYEFPSKQEYDIFLSTYTDK